MLSDTEHLLICLLAIHVSHFVMCLFSFEGVICTSHALSRESLCTSKSGRFSGFFLAFLWFGVLCLSLWSMLNFYLWNAIDIGAYFSPPVVPATFVTHVSPTFWELDKRPCDLYIICMVQQHFSFLSSCVFNCSLSASEFMKFCLKCPQHFSKLVSLCIFVFCSPLYVYADWLLPFVNVEWLWWICI